MRTHSSQSPHTREHVNRSGKYLSFHLGDEEYAIQVLKVVRSSSCNISRAFRRHHPS